MGEGQENLVAVCLLGQTPTQSGSVTSDVISRRQTVVIWVCWLTTGVIEQH